MPRLTNLLLFQDNMSLMSNQIMDVKLISECFVKPKTLVKEPYHLSPLDHVLLSVQYIQKGLLFFKPDSNDAFMETWLCKLKDSLAQTLVHFYPLAGRLSATGNPIFVDCNNSPGARFIHAKTDLSVSDILGSNYVPLVVQSFFDHNNAWNRDGHTMSLLSVKVTELVDGVFIGMSMNHSIVDGTSFWHFFNSFSEIFSSQVETNDNTNNGSFCLKNPPIFRQASGPICRFPFSEPDNSTGRSKSPVFKERKFHFSSETVRLLKSKANQDCGTTNISSLQPLTAFIWKCITRARKLPNDQETTCRFGADNRSRMDPPLPLNFFGVYISLLKTIMKVGNLLENEFGFAALKLHEAVSKHTSENISSEMDGYLKSPTDLRLERLSSPNIVHMGSSPRFNKYGCKFGMGKALAVRSGCASKYDGKVSAYPGREGDGSIDLEVCLLPKFMEALESEQEFMSYVYS